MRISAYLGSGSDYTGFSQRIGIPCIDGYFNKDKVYFTYNLEAFSIFVKRIFLSSY
jgi:hypothetical protein